MFNVMGTLDDRHIETSERFVPDEDSFPQVSGRAPVGGDEHIRSRGKRAVPLIFTWKSPFCFVGWQMPLRIKQNTEPDHASQAASWYGGHYFNTSKTRW